MKMDAWLSRSGGGNERRYYSLTVRHRTFRFPPPDLSVCLVMQEQTGSSRLDASHCGLLKMFPIADILEMTFECPLNGDLLDSLCKGWFGLSKVLSVC